MSNDLPQEIFDPNVIPVAQREPVSCLCGGVAFHPLAALYADKFNVQRRQFDPFAFLKCDNCGKVFPMNAPTKSKVQPD